MRLFTSTTEVYQRKATQEEGSSADGIMFTWLYMYNIIYTQAICAHWYVTIFEEAE